MSYDFLPRDTDPQEIMRRADRLRAETVAALFVRAGRAVARLARTIRMATATRFHPPRTTIDQAILELEAYNDNELADLGIHRGQIEDVVRHGRPGIERPAA